MVPFTILKILVPIELVSLRLMILGPPVPSKEIYIQINHMPTGIVCEAITKLEPTPPSQALNAGEYVYPIIPVVKVGNVV